MTQPETTLTIVIPAYDEEDAIEAICERCVAAKQRLLSETDLDDVELIVVSDGSTDATVARATRFADAGQLRLIAYAPNAGYGAALKRGFCEGRGGLVAFLDADGTCDPEFLVPLTNACLRDGADIACGSRMHPGAKMPLVRRLGNRLFSGIINLLAQTELRDSASGMRVLRRSSLARLYPLPDGLHFTPAMSCRAMLDAQVRLVELDMPYEERVGRSKLNVVTDGLRFLRVILDTALTYRPFRLFGATALLLLGLALLLGLSIAHAKWISPGYEHLPRWYLIRMLTALTAASAGMTIALLGLVAERLAVLIEEHQPPPGVLHRVLLPPLKDERILFLGLLFAAAGVLLNGGTFSEWARTGHITLDLWWSYIVTGAFLIVTGLQLAACGVLDRIIALLADRRRSQAALEAEASPAVPLEAEALEAEASPAVPLGAEAQECQDSLVPANPHG
ncbi:MAG: glycosyltransferase family 2 protein [Planctomycetota bacterium]